MNDICLNICPCSDCSLDVKDCVLAKAYEKTIAKKVSYKRADTEIYCPNCHGYIKENEYFGYPIGEDENFCKICGTALDWS